MWWRWFWLCLKMIYKLFCCSVSLIFFCFNVLWFFCNLAIPWCTLTLLIICVASKFVKLQRSPNEKRLLSLLNTPDDWPNYWPIANRGAGYDAPENSKAAVKKVCVYVRVCVTSAKSIGGCFKTYVCMKINNIPPCSAVPRTWLPQCPPGCRYNSVQ